MVRDRSFEEARAALLEVTDLEYLPDALQLLVVAMASQNIGRTSEASSYYDRAAARMEETYPDSPRFQRLREEAAELLGIED